MVLMHNLHWFMWSLQFMKGVTKIHLGIQPYSFSVENTVDQLKCTNATRIRTINLKVFNQLRIHNEAIAFYMLDSK